MYLSQNQQDLHDFQIKYQTKKHNLEIYYISIESYEIYQIESTHVMIHFEMTDVISIPSKS